MAEKFEVEIPISVKGGVGGFGDKAGERVVKEIAGLSKGLKGLATKFGAIGVAVTAAVGLLAKSSPYLKGILDIFGRAFMIFFRPFGDFLATLLRPLAILLMKMAVAFLKWTRPITGKVREAVEGVPQIPTTGMTLPDIAIGIANWALKIGAALGAVVWEIGKGAFELGMKIGQWLFDEVIVPAGDFLSAKLFDIWNWTKDFPGWLWGKIISIWTWEFDFGAWLWDKITSIWSWTWDFGGWLKSRIIKALDPTPGNILSKILGFQAGGTVPGPLGKPQLAVVHGGETITPRTGGKSIIFRPTFQIRGNFGSDIDMDAIVRRAGRMTERDLKQRGII